MDELNRLILNKYKLPVIGLGTWQSKNQEAYNAVKYAIDIGYRHIDCAFVYGNEIEVGNAVQEKIKDGTISRQDIFITSKLWNTYHNADLVDMGLKKTLSDLNPLGGPGRPWAPENEMNHLLTDDVIKTISQKHGKTVPQILIRFQVERGIPVIPKSVTFSRIRENFDVFDFKLDKSDMSAIESLDRNHRYIAPDW